MAGRYSIYNTFFFPLIVASYSTVIGRTIESRHPAIASERKTPAKDSLPYTAPSDSPNENILHPGERVSEKIRDNLFVKAEVTKTECFIGEPIIVTYKLYSRLNSKSSISRQPALNGFSKNELIRSISLKSSTERIKGRLFQVHILRKTLVVPQVGGNLEIDPMAVEHEINFLKLKDDLTGSGTQFSDLFNKMRKEEDATSSPVIVTTYSTRLPITVNELPASNKPPGFSGAVGAFTMHARILPAKPMVDEFVSVLIEVKGKGDLSLIEPPDIQLPRGLEFSRVKPVPFTKTQDLGFYSSRMFEYLAIARRTGSMSVPAVSLSYFDPFDKSYKNINTMPITIQVHGTPKKIQEKAAPKQEPLTAEVQAGRGEARKRSVLAVIGVIAAAIFIFWQKAFRFFKWSLDMIRNGKSEPESVSTATPVFRATEKLRIVKEMIEAKDFTSCYHELNKALWDVLTEKLSLPPTEFSKGNIFAELGRRGWTPEDKFKLEVTMNEYERNLYVPGYKEESDFESVYSKALPIFIKLEQLPGAVVKQECN